MAFLNNYINKILKTEFSRNVFKLASGTTIAQALPIIASLLIARLYSPEEIGAFTFLISIINIGTILGTCRFDQAIVLPKEDAKGRYLFYLVFLINSIVTICIFIIILIFKSNIAAYAKYPKIEPYLFLLPIIVFFAGLHQSLNYWNNRHKTFSIIAYGKIIRNFTMVVFQLSLSFLHIGGLLVGKLLGELSSTVFFFIKSPKIKKNSFKELKPRLKEVFVQYIDFLKFTTPNAFLNYLSNSLPVLILPRLFSMRETGYYSWSLRIIQTPMSIITTSIQQVFYQKANSNFNSNISLYPIVKSTYKKLFMIGFLPYLFVFVFAPTIFSILFGEEWIIAGEYTRYLIPWFFLMFLNSPITSIILILNKQKEYLLFEILLITLRFLSLLVSYHMFKKVDLTIICYGAVGLFFNLFLIFYLIQLAKKS